MKSYFFVVLVSVTGSLLAQSSVPPAFSDHKVGTPVLSLQEAIATNDLSPAPRQFTSGKLGPAHTFLDRASLTAEPRQKEESPFTLRVVPPNAAVDYKMKIVVPDTGIDPKMIIEMGSAAQARAK